MQISQPKCARSRKLSAFSFSWSVVITLLLPSATVVQAGSDHRAPVVPAVLQVPEGNKVSFHAYAVGVQIYIATPSPTSPTGFSWTFKAPEAVLFDADSDVVGLHYVGPTWETESGSKVVGVRVAGVTVDLNAIPWLLLKASFTEGPGVLDRTTYIQRVNAEGGLTPGGFPSEAGQEIRVPYTAEYFFYRTTH